MVDKFSNKDRNEKVYFVGIGLSMGANLMMKVAGEKKEKF